LFVAHGLDVAMWDPDPSAPARIETALERQLSAAKRLAKIDAPEGRWRMVATPAAAVDGAGFDQESGPEDLEAKRALFGQIGAALGSQTIVASSTSTLMPSVLQQELTFAERLLVGHPVNPPHIIPLVEIVGGKLTSEVTVERTTQFYRSLGKYPIRLRTERQGHLICGAKPWRRLPAVRPVSPMSTRC
jgi:3-hydroxyacyl-CoA dehydrogenase